MCLFKEYEHLAHLSGLPMYSLYLVDFDSNIIVYCHYTPTSVVRWRATDHGLLGSLHGFSISEKSNILKKILKIDFDPIFLYQFVSLYMNK